MRLPFGTSVQVIHPILWRGPSPVGHLVSLETNVEEDGGSMTMSECEDDELALVDTTGNGHATEKGVNGATDGVGEVDAISREGFLLHFFHMGTEVGQEQALGD
jgi:hypothetical protein